MNALESRTPPLADEEPVNPVRREAGACLTVRLKTIAQNYRTALKLSSPAAVGPVVKADAYGLGMAEIVGVLSTAGADTFFVARLEEGAELRSLLPRARIFVFDGVARGTVAALAAHRLTPVLNSIEDIAEWSALARANRTMLDAALQIDTGMNRSGLGRAQVSQLAGQAGTLLDGINLALIMSHLACAEEAGNRLNGIQLERFRAALGILPQAPASLAATSGIALGRDYLFDLVRPGIGLYGGAPQKGRDNPYKMPLTLTGKVLQVRRVEAGETAGYGARFMAARPSMLVTVAFGYADGILRHAGPEARAMLGGVKVPFAGRISMDLVVLDATDVPVDRLERGAQVEFLGENISLEQMAEAAHTVPHEVLTSIHPRVRRVYDLS